MNRPRWALLLALAAATGSVMAATAQLSWRFSDSAPGSSLPAQWKPYPMSRHASKAVIQLLSDDGTTVLHIKADHSAGGIAHRLDLPPNQQLHWRWKVDHSVAKANLRKKHGDDFAARVYVFFDLPKSALSFRDRLKLRLADMLTGETLPRAALCYVWDNTHPIGTIAPNPFYGAAHTIVLQSGNSRAGQWQVEQRDVAADFQAAFGRAVPRITGVAVASDTDNTGGQVQAWFGDLTLVPDTMAPDPTASAH